MQAGVNLTAETSAHFFGRVTSLRTEALELLEDMSRFGLAGRGESSILILAMQGVANRLGAVEAELTAEDIGGRAAARSRQAEWELGLS
jgi:hypothetical protein